MIERLGGHLASSQSEPSAQEELASEAWVEVH